jgi:hypothetical protein
MRIGVETDIFHRASMVKEPTGKSGIRPRRFWVLRLIKSWLIKSWLIRSWLMS